MKASLNLLNIKSYLVGNFRYKVYGTEFQWLIRKHILQQINWRTKVMSPECYHLGSCTLCGCATTALQMANKACDKPCYPTMMNKFKWKMFNKKGYLIYDDQTKLFWQLIKGILICKKEYNGIHIKT